jgi:NAD(P)H dehydrogenase (quinone)
MSYVVTGATGQLGRRTVDQLLARVAPEEIAIVVRNPAKAERLAQRGVQVRVGDYAEPASLSDAFAADDRVVFISTNVPGERRIAQHRAVIEAACAQRVGLLAYTSVLHAPTASFSIGRDHWATEQLINASGVPSVMLRNGWYNENYTGFLGPTLAAGRVLGAAGDGRISTAAIGDYAAAAATLITTETPIEPVYELSGDDAWSLADFADLLSRRTGRTITYDSLDPAEYKSIMIGAGVPEDSADALLEADAAIAQGELSATPGTLGQVIGRPTTAIEDAVDAELAQMPTSGSESH